MEVDASLEGETRGDPLALPSTSETAKSGRDHPARKLTTTLLNAVIPDSVENKREVRHKIGRGLLVALSVGIFVLAIVVVARTFSQISLGELRSAVAATSGEQIAMAFVFTTISFIALTGYDALALRQLKLRVPYPT